MSPLRVLLVDDHEVVRLGLHMLLEQQDDVEVVGEAGSSTDAVRLTQTLQPDVVIMDIRMPPGVSGIDACREIAARWPQIQVIMLTSFADDQLIAEAIQAGAVGYVLKQGGTGELVRALEAVRQGNAVLDPTVTRRVLAMMRQQEGPMADPFRDLTARELEILAQLAVGKSNADIAIQLFLSDKTVRNHISVILDKLNVRNRVEAATLAVEHNIQAYRARQG